MALAFVLVSCELGAEKALIDELKTFDAVKEAKQQSHFSHAV